MDGYLRYSSGVPHPPLPIHIHLPYADYLGVPPMSCIPMPMYIVLTTNIFPFQHIFLSHVTIPYRGISYRWVTWDIPIPEGMEKELLEYLERSIISG